MDRNVDRTRWLLAAVLAALTLAAPAAAQERDDKPPKPLKPVRVQLLGINDFHGHLQSTTPGTIVRRPDERFPAGGIEYLATHVRTLRERARYTFTVASGDLVGASPLLSSLFHDEPTIEAMNALGLDVAAVGNHEFDEGVMELRRLKRGGCHPIDGCADGTPYEGADFPFLAANVLRRGKPRPIFPPYAIREIGPVKIGFIGLTLEGTPDLISPDFSRYLTFRDEARTINRYARELKRRGVRAIVVLLHEGGFTHGVGGLNSCPGISGPVRKIVRRTTRDIDAFLTGHSHQVYNCTMWGRRVTSAASYGRLLTRLQLQLDRRTGEVEHIRSRNWVIGQWVPPAPDMTGLIARYRTFAAPLGDRVIGRLAGSASRYRDDSDESRMGNLVADAQQEAAGSDAAFIRPGQVRAGLAAGRVSFASAFMTQPFGTSIVSMTLTGAQVLNLLKEQWCERSKRREILQVSGDVSYTWSASAGRAIRGKPCATSPNPVTNLTIGGEPVDPARAYRITVNSAMAGRTDAYPTLAQGTARSGGPQDIEALEGHLEPSVTGAPQAPPETDRLERVP
jgi:5'-nucleotidase